MRKGTDTLSPEINEKKGRSQIKANETNLLMDDDGEIGYQNHSNEPYVDYETELLNAICSEDTPERVKAAEKYNQENELEDTFKRPRIHNAKVPTDARKVDDIEEHEKQRQIREDERLYNKKSRQSRREINEVLQGMVY